MLDNPTANIEVDSLGRAQESSRRSRTKNRRNGAKGGEDFTKNQYLSVRIIIQKRFNKESIMLEKFLVFVKILLEKVVKVASRSLIFITDNKILCRLAQFFFFFSVTILSFVFLSLVLGFSSQLCNIIDKLSSFVFWLF